MWRDATAARAATEGNQQARLHMCLDGEPPDRCETHPGGCPPLTTIDGFEFRKFPARYVTPRVRTFLDLARLQRAGSPPLSDPTAHWPPPLAEAMAHLAGS